MTDTPTPGYPEPPRIADEATTLVGSLERQRATFAHKCADLDDVQLRVRLLPSELTLGRLLKHLAYMEDLNFASGLGGGPLPSPWCDVDADARSDWALESADHYSAADLYRWWDDAVARSRTAIRTALADGGPGATFRDGHGHQLTVRRLLVDLVEEYGRHTGQADLIRESIDGRVGEDPPGPARPFAF